MNTKLSKFGDARLTLMCTGEGSSYRSSQIWSLRKVRDHSMLIVTDISRSIGFTIVYQKCQ